MDLVQLSKIASDETKAEAFLRGKGILKTFRTCPYCGSDRVKRARRKSYKCYGCKREWGVRKGSVLERSGVKYGQFLLALKMFELEIPVLRAAKELGLAYNTVRRLYMLFRKKIVEEATRDDLLWGEVEMDESYFGGRRKGKRGRGAEGKIPVFGILERGGKVKVEVVKDVKAETLLREVIRKVKRGSLVYTDQFRGYDSLVMYGFRHERIDHGKRFKNGKVYINGIEGFWSYAKERLMQFHGLSPRWFPYYLKELEYRYNHRDEDLYKLFLELLRVE